MLKVGERPVFGRGIRCCKSLGPIFEPVPFLAPTSVMYRYLGT